MDKLRMIKFWIVAFCVIIFNSIKNNNWHMVTVDFDFGKDERGASVRKKLIAMKRAYRLEIYWQENKNG